MKYIFPRKFRTSSVSDFGFDVCGNMNGIILKDVKFNKFSKLSLGGWEKRGFVSWNMKCVENR